MNWLSLTIGALVGAVVLTGVILATDDVRQTAAVEPGTAKVEARLSSDAGRSAISHQIPNFMWFGERDESRLASRPLGSFSEIIETGDGVVVVLDAGSNVVVTHDPANATTELAQGTDLPPITPWQMFDSPEEVVLVNYDDVGSVVRVD